MENNGKRKLNLNNVKKINSGVNPKIVYHETGKIIANPFLNDDLSYYEKKTKK